MGKMWWIPCSDWLPERVRRAHLVRSRSLALIPRRKTIALNGLTRLAIFSQCRRWSRKKAKNIKTTLNNSYGFIVFETNESFLILITSKSFCFLINPLVTKLFRSRWLDITLVFFFFFCVANVQPSWSHTCVLHLWINVAVWATAHPLLPSPDLTIVNW